VSRDKFNKKPKDLYNENHKPLKREIEEDIRKWEDLPCCGLVDSAL
jgi:hypothetical protein